MENGKRKTFRGIRVIKGVKGIKGIKGVRGYQPLHHYTVTGVRARVTL